VNVALLTQFKEWLEQTRLQTRPGAHDLTHNRAANSGWV